MPQFAQFFRELDTTGQVDFTAPSCPGGVYPEPEVQVPTVGSVDGMVPTWNTSVYRPGNEVAQIFGTNLTWGRVDVRLPLATVAVVQALKGFRDRGGNFVWSPDGGATLYIVCYLPGDSLTATPADYEKSADWYKDVRNQLKVQGLQTGSGSGS